MLHRFIQSIDGIPMPERFTYPFCYVPHPLVEVAAEQVKAYLRTRTDWSEELDAGKMFGVLVVVDSYENLGFLAAYSGNIAHYNRHSYFVPPVYDLLQPEGYFRKEEARISAINHRISVLQHSPELLAVEAKLTETEQKEAERIVSFRSEMKVAKRCRDNLRKAGVDDETEARLIAESQYQKAELKRMQKRCAEKVAILRERIGQFKLQLQALSDERRERSAALQRWLFDRFRVRNALGEERGLTDIFSEERGELPPGGAGECAAPKLLQYAYLHGYRPVAMGEFWWGRSPVGEVRCHGCFYPSCKSKCEPILHFMLRGLNVDGNPLLNAPTEELKTVYEDEFVWVVDKPSGLLSVPGKGEDDSVDAMARRRFPSYSGPFVVHRLDMHTSGLLVVAKTAEAFRHLQSQFAERNVEKCYIALLDGDVPADEGEISLPLRPDFDSRPRQMVDYEFGKEALTHYRVLGRGSGRTRMAFYPVTGRTHQLRVHAAHAAGLGVPIVGDLLYGTPAKRLCLHASSISFSHPVTGQRLTFTSTPDF